MTPKGVGAIGTMWFDCFCVCLFRFLRCSGDLLGAGGMITMMLQAQGNRNRLREFQVDFKRTVFPAG
jgi:hypothetical protein